MRIKAINEALHNKDTFLEALQANIAAVLNEHDDKGVDAVDSKLLELQRELLSLANSKNDYNDLASEIHRLRDLKQDAQVQNTERQGKRQRIEEMARFLKEQTSELMEFDDQLVRRVIEKITIFDGKVTVEFKSSIELEIEI